jgi:hypothetical protein
MALTDQPPTNPGDVSVVGQRMRPNGLFPPSPGGGGGNPGDDGGIHQDELDPDNPGPDPSPPHPCDSPETALEWNADAAAAEALRLMQADANDPLLDGRERSFVIYRDPVTGQIRLGIIAVGTNMGGEVTPNMTGINRGDVIGTIHSHPGSGPYPSGPDRSNFTNFWQPEIAANGGDPSLFRIYIVGTRADPGGPARLQIRVYNRDNLHGDEANPGPEVNPDGEFWPN